MSSGISLRRSSSNGDPSRKRGFVGGNGVDDLAAQGLAGISLNLGQQLGETAGSGLSHQIAQSGFDQVTLGAIQEHPTDFMNVATPNR